MFLFLCKLCGLFRALPWSDFFHRENKKAKKEPSHPHPFLSLFSLFLSPILSYLSRIPSLLSLYANPLSLLPACHSFVFISITLYPFSCFPLSPPFLFCWGCFFIFCDLMSKKSKGVGFDPTTLYGIGMCEDAKARLKHQTLLQDYEELRKEADVMRSKLEAAKQRRLMLVPEVRFLQRRHKRLVKMKSMNSFDEQNLVQEPNSLMQTKMTNESRRRSQAEPKSKKRHDVKQAAEHDASTITNQSHKKMSYGGKEAKGHRLSSSSHLVSDLNHQGILHVSKETLPQNTASVIVQNHNERIISANDANLRNSAAAFDLNQDSTPSGSLPSQAPIFDLNEISTGDEDFQGNGEAIKFGEAKKSLIRGINEEPQSDLKLAICRNAGESSSRPGPGKRKISWQDPVALRV